MSTGPRWSKHYRHVWEERSGDAGLPTWLRVASLAYGVHRANGHAPLRPSVKGRPGDLALVLGEVDPGTGEVLPADRHVVARAVDTAVQHGWLAPGSSPACLIIPGHAVAYNVGNPAERCQVNHTAARVKHDRARVRSAA